MNDWINFYDSEHTIYANDRHRDVHFETIAKSILPLIPSADAVVIDWSCGEALSAPLVARQCGKLILAEPATSLRKRLASRFANVANIEVRSLDELADFPPGSVDLIVMNSVSQYMDPAALDETFATARRLLKPTGRLIVGDVLHPDVGMVQDALALLGYAWQNGFLRDAFIGLCKTAVSDYRKLRAQLGLQTYLPEAMLQRLQHAGFNASRAPDNLGFNRWRMTFTASRPLTQA